MPARFQRQVISYSTREAPGSVIIDTPNTYLYLGMGDGKAKGTGLGGKIVAAMASGLRSTVHFDPAHAAVRARLAFHL